MRVNCELDPNDKLTFRYNLFMPVDDARQPSADWSAADPNWQSFPQRQQNILMSYTMLFSPTFFMTGAGGFFRYRNHVQGHNLNEDLASQIGLSAVGADAFPRFNIGGNPNYTSLGQAGNHQRLFAFTNFEYTAHFTKVTGSQTFKFGVDYRRYQGSELGRQSASGIFDFANTDTRRLAPDRSVISGTGSDLASFLIGQADRARVQANPSFGRRSGYVAAFSQDDWRVNNELTLNLGLRYEYEPPSPRWRTESLVGTLACLYRLPGPMAFAVTSWVRSSSRAAMDIPETQFEPTETTLARDLVSPIAPAAEATLSSAAGSR